MPRHSTWKHLQTFGASSVVILHQTVTELFHSLPIGPALRSSLQYWITYCTNRPEVASDVISGIAVEEACLNVLEKFGDSRSNRSRDMQLPHDERKQTTDFTATVLYTLQAYLAPFGHNTQCFILLNSNDPSHLVVFLISRQCQSRFSKVLSGFHFKTNLSTCQRWQISRQKIFGFVKQQKWPTHCELKRQ